MNRNKNEIAYRIVTNDLLIPSTIFLICFSFRNTFNTLNTLKILNIFNMLNFLKSRESVWIRLFSSAPEPPIDISKIPKATISVSI